MDDKHTEQLFNEYMDTEGPTVDDDTREWLHDAFLAGRQSAMPKHTEEADADLILGTDRSPVGFMDGTQDRDYHDGI